LPLREAEVGRLQEHLKTAAARTGDGLNYSGTFSIVLRARNAFLALILSLILRNWETQAMLLMTMTAIARHRTVSLSIFASYAV
jgi:hypothetical protein